MTYLQRASVAPSEDPLNESERRYITQHFEVFGAEVSINGEMIYWEHVDEIEVVESARYAGVSGWLVKKFVMPGKRYHIALYYGHHEAVLTNVNENVAKYILAMIAYRCTHKLKYTGVEGLVPLSEI